MTAVAASINRSSSGTIFPAAAMEACYTVRYEPLTERISPSTAESHELELPNRLAELIPYFVKGDILRVDEPEEAKDAHTLFYGLLDEIAEGERLYLNMVRTVYKMD